MSSSPDEVAVDLQPNNEVINTNSNPVSSSRKRSIEQVDNDERPAKIRITETTEDNTNNSNTSSGCSTPVVTENVTKTEKSVDHTNLVASHYNAMEEKGLKFRDQSRIVYMRNFNNWIKSMLIGEYLDKLKEGRRGNKVKVLDMCCGKGGDLFKWLKGNIGHLICADIADKSIEQCQIRYKDLSKKDQRKKGFEPPFSAEFIVADCTKVRLREKYKDASNKLDLVSCQFALHYSFESLPQAEMMLKNASECLNAGGFFIGTIPDAYDIVSRWQKSETNKFGNEIYSIDFQCDSKETPPLFGAKYNFHLEGVVDCPEFLVYLPLLKKLALKNGLKLVMFERFEDFYKRMIKDRGQGLLKIMQGLEPYPGSRDTPLVSKNKEDYEHASQYLKSKQEHQKIGTLSQSEWEATSLYAVFAFQKMKTSWDKEGKPIYEDL